MKKQKKMLAVIPARGGSKGLPGKNIRPLCGLPLIAHSIKCAKMCPEIDRVIVTTDDKKIAKVAEEFGAEVPFIRPAALAQDNTPMWPVVRHALLTLEEEGDRYDYLVLLDPTSPGRLPEDVKGALVQLKANPNADGIVGVSRPEFNPIWHCVTENKEGYLNYLIDGGEKYGCRQDVPPVYRINATLYIWRAEFVRLKETDWLTNTRQLVYEIPEKRAIHIDDLDEFQRAELFLQNRFVVFPWLT